MFNYLYYYNGAGVAAGDFNNDGKIDLYFGANQTANKLFINRGGLKFQDVSAAALPKPDGSWTTGLSVVDINNDGMLDIYICKVGNFRGLRSANKLLVCTGIVNGVPTYEDKAASYGLAFSGFSTQAAFFDYDGDGDLDMFLLNHSVHENANFAPRSNFIGTSNELAGDRLYRNDNGTFKDATASAGINSSAIGYGLGVVISDLNNDGRPDIYVGNDFHENDYLYYNNGDGSFTDTSNALLMHTSKYTMGVDAADANNDGYPEIISLDMLPQDAYILRRSMGDDDYDVFNSKLDAGYSYQYSRNNLQYHRKNGSYSEVGLYAGIAATDWSWAPLWIDFDNDGTKDLFISNGIPKRLNDIDYVNYLYNDARQASLASGSIKDLDLDMISKFPEIKIRNKFYQGSDSLRFNDLSEQVKDDSPSYSNGAIYADLDNDGDLDIVVNNINDAATLYENTSSDRTKNRHIDLQLTGSSSNRNAIGSKLLAFSGTEIASYEKFPVHGFMSSMEIPLHIGLGKKFIDSAILVWPDGSFEHLQLDTGGTIKQLHL